MRLPVSNSYTNATLPLTGATGPAELERHVRSPPPTTARGSRGRGPDSSAIVPKTTIPQAAAARPWTAGGRRRVHRPRRSTSAAVGAGRQRDCTRRRGLRRRLDRRATAREQHYAKVELVRRRAVLLRPRPRRLPVLRGHAGRVRRALAGGLGRDPDRPARQRVAEAQGHRQHVQARRLPVHQRPEQLPTATARTGRAGSATPTTTRATRPGRWRKRSTTPRTRPGVEVASSATWVGSNDTRPWTTPTRGGGYNLEVKMPMADLPAAVDPQHMGLNITPYDNDNTAADGHDPAAPHRPEHPSRVVGVRQRAVRPVPLGPRHGGRLHAAGRPADRRRRAPNVSHPNLDGADSPQTIAQSARNGVPISGRVPAPASDRITRDPGRWSAAGACTCGSRPGHRHRPRVRWPERSLHPGVDDELHVAADPPPD